MPTGIYVRSEKARESYRKCLLQKRANGKMIGFKKGNQFGKGRVKSKEEIDKIKKALAGKKKPIGFSEKCRQREILNNKLGKSNSPFKNGHKINVGRICSQETKEKLRKKTIGRECLWMKGEKHFNWQGGKSSIGDKIRKGDIYKNWLKDIYKRDNYTCQECGKHGGRLEAHHIKSYTLILKENNIKTYQESIKCDELWDMKNMVTLCKKCHDLTKRKK